MPWQNRPVSHPLWERRAKQLVQLMEAPVTTAELFFWAQCKLGWNDLQTRNVLAFSEGKYVYYYEGRWHRGGQNGSAGISNSDSATGS